MTAFAQQLRAIRARHGERLFDMAKRIEVSSSFLSALETGKKEPPHDFLNKIVAVYNLNEKEKLNLALAISAIRKTFKLTPKNQFERDTISLLARRMDSLSEDDHRKIQETIEKIFGRRGDDG
jgi:transcriptional regulator with XRE-family HTH domain